MTEIIFADDTPQEMRDEVLRLAANWRPKPRKLFLGVGINDADYITHAHTNIGQWTCPIMQKWRSMLTRIYSPDQYYTYIGTVLDAEWISFMSFRSWCLGNRWKSDYHLDKDIITNGKIYGPNSCAFIPQQINKFFNDRALAGNLYPTGVSIIGQRYQASCSDPINKCRQYLGLFDTPEEAHLAWKKRKHEHAIALADMYPDLDPCVLDALRNKYKSS